MSERFHILLIEDSRGDVKIIDRALRESSIPHRLTVLHDGARAIEYLEHLREPNCEPALEPDLVLLDLNLPGLDGCEILARVKSDKDLRSIPIVILTTSRRDEDVSQTYLAGANTYIQKPSEFPHYRELVMTLHRYWSETAIRPPRRSPPREKV